MSTELVEVEIDRIHVPYPIPAASVIGGHVILYGYSIAENTGTAGATLDIYDGTDTKGLLAMPVFLAAAQSVRDWFGPQGIHFRGGLFTVATGSVIGSLLVCLEADDERWGR